MVGEMTAGIADCSCPKSLKTAIGFWRSAKESVARGKRVVLTDLERLHSLVVTFTDNLEAAQEKISCAREHFRSHRLIWQYAGD
jgi:hypothetical protein